jgi:hypothetical protein
MQSELRELETVFLLLLGFWCHFWFGSRAELKWLIRLF